MSGPLTVPLTILAFYVSNKTFKVLYAALALLCGFYTAFSIWLKERERYEAEVASHTLRDYWKYLQGEFSRYPCELYAHWILKNTTPTKRDWNISGANDQIEGEHFRVLLEEAGNFLRRADWIVKTFRGINDPDPISRWLDFVCEVHPGLIEATGSAHVKEVEFESGDVGDLARTSSLVCAELAAKETLANTETKSILQSSRRDPSGQLPSRE